MRVLLTGMSGAGKSTVIAELARRGRRAVDLDADAWSTWVDVPADAATPGTPVAVDRDWVWREDRVAALLAEPGELFAAGCAANMGSFLPRFDHVVLLSAPLETLVARLAARATGYGTAAAERERVADLVASVEPLLRRAADRELDTRAPLDEVVDAVLDLSGRAARRR